MSNPQSTANNRENARQATGRFGYQEHGEDGSVEISGFPVTDPPLIVAAGTNEEISDPLAQLGLRGTMEPYQGDNVDVTADAVLYRAPSGTELILDRDPHEGFVVTYDNGDPDYQFRMPGSEPNKPTGPDDVDTIKRALWDVALTGAEENSPLAFSEGDYFEVREADLSTNKKGEVVGEFLIQNHDDDYYNHLNYNFATDKLTLTEGGGEQPYEGVVLEAELDAMLVDMRNEPTDGADNTEHTKNIFKELMKSAGTHEDAPHWARTQARKTRNKFDLKTDAGRKAAFEDADRRWEPIKDLEPGAKVLVDGEPMTVNPTLRPGTLNLSNGHSTVNTELSSSSLALGIEVTVL